MHKDLQTQDSNKKLYRAATFIINRINFKCDNDNIFRSEVFYPQNLNSMPKIDNLNEVIGLLNRIGDMIFSLSDGNRVTATISCMNLFNKEEMMQDLFRIENDYFSSSAIDKQYNMQAIVAITDKLRQEIEQDMALADDNRPQII